MAADVQPKEVPPRVVVEPVRSEGEDPCPLERGEALFPVVAITEADWQQLQYAYDRSVESCE